MKTNHLGLTMSPYHFRLRLFTLGIIIMYHGALFGQKNSVNELLISLNESKSVTNTIHLDIVNEKGRLETFQIHEKGRFSLTDQSTISSWYGSSLNNTHRKIHMSNNGQSIVASISEMDKYYTFQSHKKTYTWSKVESSNPPSGCLASSTKHHKTVSKAKYNNNDVLTYKIAITATPEFSQMHGNTIMEVMTSIMNYINQVNMIYERDLGIRFEMVADAEKLIFLDSQTNPFSDDLAAAVQKNIVILNDSIGESNYDIGHLFTTGGAGFASIQAACGMDKGSAASGFTDPANFPNLVAHEIGHQLGASHTWNSCNQELNETQRSPSSAMEPGSGSTIMSYGGLCGSNNVVDQRSSYFHAISLQQIQTYTRSGAGRTCAASVEVPNDAPIISYSNNDTKYIPIMTPFLLEAQALDDDGDAITYAWDNVDQDIPTGLGQQTAYNPLIRSRLPTTTGRRYIPSLTTLSTGVEDPSEPLPIMERNIAMRLVARDNHTGYGKSATSDFQIKTDGSAGPFKIISPPNQEWYAEGMQHIQWDVANTTNQRVDCQFVNIFIDYDGSLEFRDTLAYQVPNDGSHYVSLPDTITTNARIMIKANDNIFFDITREPISIVRLMESDFQVFTDTTSETICVLDEVSFPVHSRSINGFQNSIRLTPQDLPEGVIASVEEKDIIPGSSTQLKLTFDLNISRGMKNVTVNAFAANGTTQEIAFRVNITNDDVVPSSLIQPIDGALLDKTNPRFTWNSDNTVTHHTLEIASNLSFAPETILHDQATSGQDLIADLASGSIYHWRVKSSNDCSAPSTSEIRSIGIKSTECITASSTSTPIVIPNAVDSINAEIIIEDDFVISSITIEDIKGQHTFISDLTFLLIAPDGDRYTLINRSCNESRDFDFSINAEGDRLRCGINRQMTYRPLEDLDQIIGESSKGIWKLRIVDHITGDAGALDNWTLKLCGFENPGIPEMISHDTIKVNPGEDVQVSNNILAHIDSDNTASELTYIIADIPVKGYLLLVNDTLSIGDHFTQADIDDEKVSYLHKNTMEEEDQFELKLTDGAGYISDNFTIMVSINNSVNTFTPSSNYHFDISPNPAHNYLNITLSDPPKNRFHVEVLSPDGKVGLQSTIEAHEREKSIDIAHLHGGVWLIKISDGNSTLTKKVVIQR